MDANNVRQQWADRSGEYSPAYYAYYGPDETSERIRTTLADSLSRDATVLELGCSSGRHLAHLHDDGFESVAGIDINEDAFDVMAEAYPDLAASGTFYVDPIEAAVERFDDGQFDAVYSAETLQHIHPDDDWVFAELARITDELLVTAEIENPVEDEPTTTGGSAESDVNYVHGELPLYYRDWKRVFTDLGFEQVAVSETKRDTVRTFRTSGQ